MKNYFEFDTKAKILSGEGALSHIPYELKIREKKKPFIMSDRGLEKFGVVKNAIDLMGINDNYFIFLDIPTDSSTSVVNEATEKFYENQCDCVIAVGGGSVIDTAKGVVLSLVSGEKDIYKLEGADSIIKKNEAFFVAVPTTAGTGSEMTSVAVIRNAQTDVKLEYISTFILPDVSVIDPEMTKTLPPKTTASTAIDALTHSIEAYSCLMKNPISDAYAISSIKLIIQNLLKAIDDGKDLNARLALGNGANLAGAAFSNSMVGGVHSIGHALGAVCHVAHGDAMGILLPHVLKLNIEKCRDYYSELLFFINEERYISESKELRAEALIDEIKKLLKTLNEKTGLPITLSQTGKVEKVHFKEIVAKAMADGSALVNPVSLTEERILKILEEAF